LPFFRHLTETNAKDESGASLARVASGLLHKIAEKACYLPMTKIVFILSKPREAHTPSVLFGGA
jgi:hypothetical protein